MIYIISGTNRQRARTRQIADIVFNLMKKTTMDCELIDIADLPFSEIPPANYDSKNLPKSIRDIIDKVDKADGLLFVVPEYNGSYPGALKYFIDHWSYPRSFEHRPVAFVGLGFRWGGLRPVEHLQQVFNYRNAFCFPERVFIQNIGDVLKDGAIKDDFVSKLLEQQSDGFVRFIRGLKDVGLHANTRK